MRASEREGFAGLVRDLSETFRPQGLLLSAALFANGRTADVAYDIQQISRYLEWISLKEEYYCGDEIEENSSDHLNINATIDYWLKKGAAPEQLIMEIMAYGCVKLGGCVQPAEMKFYEICEKTKKFGFKVVRNKTRSLAYNDDQLVIFDDVENIRAKGKLIYDRNLGGGMVWPIQYDDFSGICGCGKFPLLTALNQELRGVGGVPVHNCA